MINKTHHISVKTEVTYIEDQSSPESEHYVFAYTITICNTGTIGAKLLSRHWIITDANGKVQEVMGMGVIGEQPYFQPGDVFEYTSAAIIPTPVGAMQGSYQMLADDGIQFDAPIAPFSLAIPHTLH